MELKRVSFKIAKAIKKAGYPQDIAREGYLFDVNGNPSTGFEQCEEFVRPTYLEVWLWLWREKDICIDVVSDHGRTQMSIWRQDDKVICDNFALFDDSEEAIITAIEYLVDNDLVK